MTTPKENTLDRMKLVFGDEKSIEARDNAIRDNLEKKLMEVVKCPFCKAKADHVWNFNQEEKIISWNFDCEDDCPNSLERCGEEMSKTDTDFNGRFLDTQADDSL